MLLMLLTPNVFALNQEIKEQTTNIDSLEK